MLPITKQNLTSLSRENLSPHTQQNLPAPPQKERHKPGRVLMDLSALKNGVKRENQGEEKNQIDKAKDMKGVAKEKDRVKERVREWEREKERLREMERLEDLERDRDDELDHAEEVQRQPVPRPRRNQEEHVTRGRTSINISSPGKYIQSCINVDFLTLIYICRAHLSSRCSPSSKWSDAQYKDIDWRVACYFIFGSKPI
jgi:hypothetical protein